MTTLIALSALALSLALPADPNQARFDALVKELGTAVASTAEQGNPQLRSMEAASVAARLRDLDQFLKSLGPDAAKLRLQSNPLEKLAQQLEIGKEMLSKGSDPTKKAIDLCEEAIGEADPLLREGALQRLEKQLRRMGDRQGALPDDAIITTDLTLTLDLVELYLSPASNIRLTELPNRELAKLHERLLATRAQLENTQDNVIAWLAGEQKLFGQALADAGILPQGTYLGRAELTDGQITIFDAGRYSQGKIPKQVFFAQVKMILAGTNVQGVITFGEGDDRSAARISGTLDPATSTVRFRASDPTLRGIPNLTVEEFKVEGTGRVASATNLAGDFTFLLNVSGTWEDELGAPQTGRIVVSAKGSWRADR